MSLSRIVEIVINEAGFDFRNNTRNRRTVDAVKVYCLLAREFTEYSFNEIGSYIDKHYSTVMHHVKTSKDLLDTDSYFKAFYSKCLSKMTNDENMLLTQYNYHLSQAREYMKKLKHLVK